MDTSEAYQELLRSKGPVPGGIQSGRPGVYVLWIDATGFEDLGLDPGLQGVGYAGVAAGSGGLKKRFREEWRPRNSGRSSPRRTIGALLRARLNLVPRPRNDRDPERGARYYTFGDEGEARLTSWIENRCSFAYLETTSDRDAVALEDRLIPYLRPPVNINKWSNPDAPRLEGLRREIAAFAREHL